jgi:hypothetical protein
LPRLSGLQRRTGRSQNRCAVPNGSAAHRTLITQFHIETGYCPCCRQRVQGRHPEQTSNAIGAAGNTLGPRVLQSQRFLELARRFWSAGQLQAIPLVPPRNSTTPTGSS